MAEADMSEEPSPGLDIGLSLFLIVVAGIIINQASRLPPGIFEPLGSAPVPTAVAWIIVGLCLLIMLRAILRLRKGAAPVAGADEGFATRPLDATVVLLMAAAYVLVMQYRLVSFRMATTLFLVLSIGFLVRFRPRAMPVALVIGLLVAFGCQYLFTRVFVVDLPAG
jgi:putative tricarboxylic transport membrane protein